MKRNFYLTLIGLLFLALKSYAVGPTISTVVVAANNSSATVTFSGGVYSDVAHTLALTNSSLAVAISASSGGGTVAAGAVAYSITHTAGNSSATITFTISGIADGTEVLTVGPTDGASIFDGAGAAMGSGVTGTGNLNDKLAPTVTSVTLANGSPTKAASVDFTVTFSESVTGLALNDFSPNMGAGVSGATVSNVSAASGTSVTVTVNSISGTGTLGLNVLTVNGINDAASNAMTTGTPTGSNLSYSIDQTPPTVTSVTLVSASPTNANSVDFTVTFSEPVNGLALNDFSPNMGAGVSGATVSNVSAASGTTITVTVNSISGDGTLGLNVLTINGINDAVTNAMVSGTPTGSNQSYSIDQTPPTVTSVTLASSSPTNAASVDFTVTFSEPVSGLATNDFSPNMGAGVSGATVSNVSAASGTTVTVTVNSISGTGTLGLNVLTVNGINDAATNALVSGTPTGSNLSYTIDQTPPTVTSVTRVSGSPTSASSVVFTVLFSEPVSGLALNDFSANMGAGLSGATVSNVSASSGTTVTVTVNSYSGTGTLGLNVLTVNGINDAVNNAMTSGTPTSTNQSYSIDRDPPTAGITLQNPLTANTNLATVIFRVTFNEPVANVDLTDFVLDPNNTAAGAPTGFNVISAGLIFDITITSVSGDNDQLNLDFAGGQDIVDAVGNPFGGIPLTDPTYNIDNVAPTLSPNVMIFNANGAAAETIVFTLSEPLNLADGAAVTGFTIPTGGAIATAIYTLATNTITLTSAANNLWTTSSTVTYTSGSGNVHDFLVGNPMATITAHAVAQDIINLAKGDVAFTSWAATPTESFSFVLLKDIPIGTVIKFTDNGWTNASSGSFGSGETYITWTADQDYFAGLEVQITGSSATAGTPSYSGPSFDLTSGGDQIFAFQGTVGQPGFVILSALTNKSSWDANNTGTGNSTLPTGLTDGTYSITINGKNGSYTTSNGKSGTRAALQTLIYGSDGRWTTDNLSSNITYPTGSATSYTLPPDLTGSPFSPVNGTTVPATLPDLAITYNANITAGTSTGSDIILIDVTAGNTTAGTWNVGTAAVTFSGATVTIHTGSLALTNAHVYNVRVTKRVFVDADGNGNTAITGATWALTADAVLPTVNSVTRKTPLTTPYNGNSVTFTVTFSENVTGASLAANDFSANTTGFVGSVGAITTGGITVNSIDVTIPSISGNGTLGLNVLTANGISDVPGNLMTTGTPTGANQTYVIDQVVPTISASSIVPADANPSNASTVHFTVNFSEHVNALDIGDFVLTNTLTANGTIASVSATSGTSITVTVNSVVGDGTMRLDVKGTATITDDANNAFTGGYIAGSTYTIDHTAPTVSSIVRKTPATTPTNVGTVTFTVNFSESVTGLANDDFSINTAGFTGTTAAAVSVSAASGTSVDVTINSVVGNGTLGLTVLTVNGISDGVTNLMTTGTPTGANDTYTIDQTPPVVSSIAIIPATLKGIGNTSGIVACPTCGNTSVSFLVTFTEANPPFTGIDFSDFTLSTTGSVSATIGTPVLTTPTTYTVPVNITNNGTGKVSLGLTDNNTILDAANNPLAGASDGSVPTSFAGGGPGSQYYTIVLPEPGNQQFDTFLQTTSITGNSVSLLWGVKNTSTPLPTAYLVMIRPSGGSFPATPVDGTRIFDNGNDIRIVTRAGNTSTVTFNGLSSGTGYDFIVYKYALSTPNNSDDNIDYELTTATVANHGELLGVPTITASVSWIADVTLASPTISSTNNDVGNSATVLQFKVYDDGLDPIVPNVMNFYDNGAGVETVTFSLREQLASTLPSGSLLSGFSASISGSIPSTNAVYYSSGPAANIITLTSPFDGAWTSATTISYSASAGNVQFLTLGKMQSISNHIVTAAAVAPVIYSNPLISNTFTVPAGVTSVIVEAWGAGGSAGTWENISYGGGGQGGGGGAYSSSVISVVPGNTYNVTVGAGGLPIVNTLNSCCLSGNPGGASSFGGGLVSAAGGQGGESAAYFVFYGTNYDGSAGSLGAGHFGLGGQATNSVGTVKWSGGNGGNGGANTVAGQGTTGVNFPNLGGSGGSSAGPMSNGVNGQSGSTFTCCYFIPFPPPAGGGTGGDGQSAGGGSPYPLNGSFPGGGGGGINALTSGAGANGQVKVTYLPTSGGASDWTADTSPFKFSGLVIKQNTPSNSTTSPTDMRIWTNVIAGAELSDGSKVFSSVTNPGNVQINATDITFTNLPAKVSGDIGYTDDAVSGESSKTYTLKIWLKPNLASDLAAQIDNKNLAFTFDATLGNNNITYDDQDASSNPELSSRLASPEPKFNSVPEPIQVKATALAFNTQPVPTSQLVLTSFTTPPVVTAVDKNENTDIDFNGIAVNITNPGTIAMNPGSTTSFSITSTSGVINVPSNFQYTDQGVGTLIANSPASGPYAALSSASAPSTGAVACSVVNVSYSNLTTITPGTLNNLTITSIANAAATAVPVFDFKVIDDGGAGLGDGADTRISQIVIVQGPTNGSTITDWSQVIQGAILSDGVVAHDMVLDVSTSPGAFTSTTITFSGIPNSNGTLGHVAEGAAGKTYTLKIYLKASTSIPTTLDLKNLTFGVNNTASNFQVASTSSGLAASQSQQSTTSQNTIKVYGTQIRFITNLITPLLPLKDISLQQTTPQLEVTDVNGNRDTNFVAPGTISISNSGGILMSPGGTNPIFVSPSSGLIDFPSNQQFQTTSTAAGVTVTISAPNNEIGGLVSSIAQTGRVIQAAQSTRIANGATAPGGVSSLANTSGTAVAVFNFDVKDDFGAAPSADDGLPTLISGLTITAGANNQITAWNEAIAGAELWSGASSITASSITATTIVFTSIPTSPANVTTLGYVPDNSSAVSKSYTLKIYLKSNMSGLQNYPATIDGKQFDFEVINSGTNITLAANSTNIVNGENSSSGLNKDVVQVVATQLDFTTPASPTSVSINTIVSPVIQARDINANVDHDFTGASGIVTAFSNSASSPVVTMLNGPVVGTTQFVSGVLDFAVALTSFQFTSGDNNETFTVSITGTGGITGSSPILTLKTNTITPGILTEPTTISSVATAAAGTNVFDFKVNDDDNLTSGTDSKPTKISQIVITQLGGGNDIADWRQIIASATLSSPGFPAIPGVVNPATGTDITFSAIPHASASDLGFITDNTSQTYTLNIVLLSSLGGSLPSTVDNLNLAFEVLATNVTVALPSSTFSTSENENSGAANNKVDVIATQLKFTTNPGPDLLVNKDISLQLPIPVVEALDADNNRDLDYSNSALVITNAGSLPMTNAPTVITNGLTTFAGTFQYSAIGDGTLTAADNTTTNLGLNPAPSNGTSTPATLVRVGVASTITAGPLAEPATISSLVDLTHTPGGLPVFDFTINDDPAGTPVTENDGNPTQISSITITQGTGNTITDWSQVFSQVQLDDGAGHSVFATAISATQLVFGPGLVTVNSTNANANSADMGYIADNGSKTFTLTVWLKTNLSGTQNYPITIDGLKFNFEILTANIGLNVNGTSIKPGENQNSGAETAAAVATQLDITTPASAISASLNVPIPSIIVESRDVNGNRDTGFNGIITAFTKATPADSTINKPTVGVSAFANGVYTFPSTFTFITGANGDIVTLKLRADNTGGNSGVTCGGNAICSGISPTITLLSSFESFITKDPTFIIPATIPYVTHQETNNNLTGSSYELIRVLLLDGSRSSTATYGPSHAPLQFQTLTDTDGQLRGDIDGANTNLSSITIQISNPSNLRTIGLFDKNGVQLGSQIDVAAMTLTSGAAPHNFVFTGSPILIAAADDSSAVFSVRASFNNTSNTVKDGDDIQIQLISASLVANSGSSFYNGNPANSGAGGPYTGGQVPGSSQSLGLIDVVTTSLDFTTQPSINYAGINEPIGVDPLTSQPYSYGNPPSLTLMPITTPGIVTARDKYALVDTGFNPATVNLQDANGNNITLPSLPATGKYFNSGVMSLNGMHYNMAVGNKGAVDVQTTSPTISSSNPAVTVPNNSVPCNSVNVLDVTVGITTNGSSITPIGTTNGQNLKGGFKQQNIFGVKFAAASTAGTEPQLKGFTIDFDVPYQTSSTKIFSNFTLQAQYTTVSGTVTTNYTASNGLSTVSSSSSSNLDQIKLSLPTAISLVNPNNSVSFFLLVDVDVTVNSATPKITPQFIDGGYGTATDQHTILSNGTAVSVDASNVRGALVKGIQYSFASTKPPVLLAKKSNQTAPYAGQDNVDPNLQNILLQFDTNVGSFDSGGSGNVELWLNDYTHNASYKVADLNLDQSTNLAWVDNPEFLVTDPQRHIQQKAIVNSNNTVSHVYSYLYYNLSLLAGKSLQADSVYFVKMIQGNYDATKGAGVGVSDFSLNLYGGISTNSTLYFKISSNLPPKLTAAVSTFNTNSLGTLTTNFDQFGKAYYLIVNSGATAPTAAEVFGLSVYGGGTIAASGNYPITSTNANQTVSFPATFTSGTAYDVYIIAENDAFKNNVLTPVKATGVYGSSTTSPPYGAGLAGPTTKIPASGAGSIPASQTAFVPNANSFLICPDSYTTLSSPMIIGETSPAGIGNITVISGSVTVTGTATSFLTDPNLAVGRILIDNLGNVIGTVLSIQTATALTLSVPATFSYSGVFKSSINFNYSQDQSFNILLPTGYQFDVSIAPVVQLVGTVGQPSGNFVNLSNPQSVFGNSSNAAWDYKYASNTLLTISFNNSNGGIDVQDYIIVSGLSVIGVSGSQQGDIKWFFGTNVFSLSYNSPVFNLATIALQSLKPPDFNNSYWLSNRSLFNAIEPVSTTIPLFSNPTGDALDKTVNTIPDNYVDKHFPGQIQLLPDPRTLSDFLASTFSGSGVSGDLFALNAVTTGSAFNITMQHTDPNGCTTQTAEQYLVYDHRSAISAKLGTAYPVPSSLAGTQQAVVNSVWPTTPANNIVSPILNDNEVAGYTLDHLTVDLPSSEIFAPGGQYMSGPSWRNLIKNNVLVTTTAPYSWNYGKILSADNLTVNSTPYKRINTLSLGLNDVYDYFASPIPTPNGNSFWKGGSLGNIEFTGIYNSTADASVFVPFRQQVELFVPAVPVVEVTTAVTDKSDITTSVDGVTTVQSLGATAKIYPSGYPGTSIFCEHGGPISISGYPLATAGVSGGSFGIYDYSKYDFNGIFVPLTIGASGANGTISTSTTSTAVVAGPLTDLSSIKQYATLFDPQGNIIGQVSSVTASQIILTANASVTITNSAFRVNNNRPIQYAAPNSAFVDAGNGTMTLDPLAINNSYKDILVTYTYEENTSPAFGVGYLVIRVTANPVASFTIASTIANPGPSGVDAFCSSSPIAFSSSSTLADNNLLGNKIETYSWNFGDQNATTNTASTALASHTYTNASGTFAVTLSLKSHWQCPSLPLIISNTTSQTTYAGSQGNVVVGDVPDPSFSFLGNCVTDPISFTDNSKLTGTNGGTVAINNWAWDFGDAKAGSGKITNHTYATAGTFSVILTATTDVAGAHGCQKSLSQNLIQLPLQQPTAASAYQEDFTNNNGGWIALNPANGSSGSWAWGQTTAKKHLEFNSSSNLWVTSLSGTFAPAEKSALYSVCLNLTNLPRPMLSYSSFVDLAANAEGLVLEYSFDNYNVTDVNKKIWNVLGSYDRITGLSDGLDWYTAAGLPSSPGDINFNPTAEGWTGIVGVGVTPKWIHPKHELDTVKTLAAKYAAANSVPPRAILRFALSTLTNSDALDGVGIDTVFIGSRTRTIMFENFTTTDAGNAVLNNTISKDMGAISTFNTTNVGTQLVNINYHVGFLGVDPFNLDNPADPSSRALYYNIQKIPYAFLDGVHSPQYGTGTDLFGDWGQRAYNLQTLQLAKADFSATAAPVNNSDGSIEVDVNFTPIIDLPAGTILQVAIVEENVLKTQLPSGVSIGTAENHFEYILKKMLPNAAGTKYTKTLVQKTPVNAGSFKWIPEKLYSNQLAVVLFLQNENTKEIYQAELFQHLTPAASIVTAIEPISADNIKVYPNPADQEFTIELPSPAQQNMKLTMANQLGQFTEVGAISEGEQSKRISTQGLTEGVYILQLGSNGNALRTKVVVLHK